MHPALIGALPFFQNEYDHIYHSLFVAQSFSVQTMQILNIQWKLQESFLWLTVVFFDETLSHPATSLKTNLKPKPTHNMLEVNLTAIQKKTKQKKPPPSVCWHSGSLLGKHFTPIEIWCQKKQRCLSGIMFSLYKVSIRAEKVSNRSITSGTKQNIDNIQETDFFRRILRIRWIFATGNFK